MNRPLIIGTMSLALAGCAVLYIGRLPAQDVPTGNRASAGATSTGSSATSTTSQNGYTYSWSSDSANVPAVSVQLATEPDPLQQEDQVHTKATRDLVGKYQQADESQQREDIREELSKVIAKHFEVRQQIRARELEELEAQISRLRELHNRREQEKEQIVRDRLQQLLRDAEGLGWGADDATDRPELPRATGSRPVYGRFPAMSPQPTQPRTRR